MKAIYHHSNGQDYPVTVTQIDDRDSRRICTVYAEKPIFCWSTMGGPSMEKRGMVRIERLTFLEGVKTQ